MARKPKPKTADKPTEAQEHPELAQHPANHGREGVEVAQRTADTDADAAEVFTREIIVPTESYADDAQFHDRQATAVRDQAIQQGLRVDADAQVTLESQREHGTHTHLVYQVPVTPAVVADPPA